MRTLLTIWVLCFTAIGYGQTDDSDNLEKYWNYRDNLRKRFMKIGVEEGESLPMAYRIPGYAYGGVMDTNGT